MEIGTVIIGAICVAACLLPFIIMSQSKKKKEKQKLRSLNQIVNSNNCVLSQHEFCGDFVIGIDHAKKMVFFCKQTDEKMNTQSVKLAEIQECQIINSGTTTKGKDGSRRSIDRLALNFFPRAVNNSNHQFEFYNSDERLQLYGELQAVKKWSDLINNCLQNKN